jgi:rhodanese-related sulfurtransferase
MINYGGLPAINAQELALKMANGREFILLDVREEPELRLASLGNWVTHVPLSALAELGTEALPETIAANQTVEIVVMCHHGIRSAQVTDWLRQQGWTNVYNMVGGIAAYATAVDPAVGRY